MEEKKVLYSAVVLNDVSRVKLINVITIPEGWEILCHHCTYCFGSVPPEFRSGVGKLVMLEADAYGVDPDNKAIAVRITNFSRLIPGQSHVTVAIDEQNGGKPKDSNKITDWIKLDKLIILSGTLEEITN